MTIDDVEITSMRVALEGLMPDTCNILTKTNASDGQGGFTQSWGTAGTAVRCRVDSKTGRETFSGGAIYPYNNFVLTLPYNEIVTTTGRIEHNSVTYNIVAVDSDKSWKITTRVILEAVNA